MAAQQLHDLISEKTRVFDSGVSTAIDEMSKMDFENI
jgi:hypothetical protein